jgi:NapH/MauN family ferredoxin-type protein
VSTSTLFLKSKSKALPPAAARRYRMALTQRVRHLIQIGFAAFILYASVQRNLATEDGTTASMDALCPFGALETAWRYISQGQFLSHIHLSTLVLGIAVLLSVLLAGGAFCGWVCPFGAVMDLMNWIRTRLHVREIQVPERIDRILRYGRYVMLGLILYQTIASVTLWFAGIDPYRTLFGLEWLFAFNLSANWVAYAIVLVVLGSSLFVERAWCRYACPLGGAISLVGNLSLLRIRREGDACKGCAVCAKPCPVKLPVESAATMSSNCIGCLACVDACPRPGALEVKLAPVWLDPVRKLFVKRTEVSHAR